MTEGTVPVPPNRPCAECDDDVLPPGGIAFKVCHSSGDEIPESFSVCYCKISRVKIQLFFESPESISLVMEQFSRAFLGDGRMVSSPFYQI
jgi:hypothetical protein